MTQIRGFIGPTRRPGELGVHSLDSFNLVVPDMEVAKTFYGEFGLDLQTRNGRFDTAHARRKRRRSAYRILPNQHINTGTCQGLREAQAT